MSVNEALQAPTDHPLTPLSCADTSPLETRNAMESAMNETEETATDNSNAHNVV